MFRFAVMDLLFLVWTETVTETMGAEEAGTAETATTIMEATAAAGATEGAIAVLRLPSIADAATNVPAHALILPVSIIR